MLTAEERLLIGLKVLERFNPSLHLRRLRNSQSLMPLGQDLEVEADGLMTYTAVSQPAGNRQAFQNGGYSLLNLQTLLASIGSLAPYSVILGACEDGLPFLLDLTNPAPGALLVAGDQGSGKTRLVQAILSSADLMNPAEQVVFSIIAQEPDSYLALAQSDSLQGILPADRPESRELIQSLAQMVEDRRHTGPQDPAIILAVDDLVSFSASVHEEILSALYTVLRHGPRSRIWTIATLSAGQVDQVEGHVLQAFRTRLLGRIMQPSLAAYLSGSEVSGAENLEPGYQFCVPFGEEWIRFWVCESV